MAASKMLWNPQLTRIPLRCPLLRSWGPALTGFQPSTRSLSTFLAPVARLPTAAARSSPFAASKSFPAFAGTTSTETIASKISDHPALLALQVRNGPRETYHITHLIRKRRYGFLARLRSRTGRNILKRRRAKGRKNLSH